MSRDRLAMPRDVRPDPTWHALYRIGGIAGLLTALVYIVATVLVFTTPEVPTEDGTETLEYIADHRTLYIAKQILWLAPSVPVMVVFLALYPALKHVSRSLALIGAVFGVSSWALSLAWPTTGEGSPILVYLSDRYAEAATDTARATFTTAAEVLIATEGVPSALGVLQPISVFVLSLAMLRGGVPRWIAYFTFVTGALGIVSEALISVLGIAYALYGVLILAWFLVIGWYLYRLPARQDAQSGS